jgi:hypothetical protein
MSSSLRTVLFAASFPALIAAHAGCSYHYIPKATGRVNVVMDGGKIGYMRDGKLYEGGIFGGDIEEAVRGNALAEDYASRFKTAQIGGFVVTIIGTGATVAGGILGGYGAAQNNSTPGSGNSNTTLGLGLIFGGLGLMLGGAIWAITGQPYLYDAINAYNDGVQPPAAPPPAPPPPPQGRAAVPRGAW